MRDLGSSSRRSKHFIAMYLTLGVVLFIQILQFQSEKQNLLSYITQESGQKLTETTAAAAASYIQQTSTSITTIDHPKQISAYDSYLELRKILFTCDGNHEEPISYWLYYFDCNDARLLPPNNMMQYMQSKGKSISNTEPKVKFTGTDIGFAGQTIDFVVAELFFMHPSPLTKGRYLEIGGYFGLEFSNSLFFEQYLDWDGWLFEPTTCYDLMVKNRPKATSFKRGLCKNKVEDMTFSGFGKCATDKAPCAPLTSMSGWEEGFDFASIDVEGSEMAVLEAIDFTKVKIKVLAVEWRPKDKDEREKYLKQFGYEKVINFHWQGWGSGDEIYYRPDLISYHAFNASATNEAAFGGALKPENSLANGSSSSIVQSQTATPPPTKSPFTTSEPSYYPTYIPTDGEESGRDNPHIPTDEEKSGRKHPVWESGEGIGFVNDDPPTQYCHVVENVCRKTQPKSWFYFNESQDNGFQTENSIPHPKQPLLSYEYMNSARTRIVMDAKSLELNATWIKEQQCTISPIKEHVVVNGMHIHMMGEYVQRIIIPLHHLLEDYTNHAKNQSRVTIEKEIQFYINFYQNEKQKILPSHHIYMNGLQYGQQLQSWNEVNDPIDKINSPPCQCYSRLVFCGYEKKEAQDPIIPSRNVSKLRLVPFSTIPFNPAKNCAHYLIPSDSLTNDGCKVWQDLRMSLLSTYYKKNPNLSQDIHAYKVNLINSALKYTNSTVVDFNKYPLKDWKIIALSQRRIWRMWLNINEHLEHCNSHYFDQQIVCIELDVEALPTNFVSVGSNQPLTAIDEQIVLYQSINALIGIHGSQLTQGILMPPNSIMVELFQWIPKDWGYVVWGDGWTNQKNHPTPMGIMWHNTDIHEVSWSLPRESVPFCQNVSDVNLHNFSLTNDPKSQLYLKDQKHGNLTITSELEYCLALTNGDAFRWDRRNFNVPKYFIQKLVDTFWPSRSHNSVGKGNHSNASESDLQACSEFRMRGEHNGFVLYNLLCKENGTVAPHHYYINP